MEIQKVRTQYRRILPHIQPFGAAFFVTFRLKDSIPTVKLLEIKEAHEYKIMEIERLGLQNETLIYEERKRFFAKFDELLDKVIAGPTHLKTNVVAQIVADEIHRHDGKLYDLIAYTILPNHVHLLIDTSLQIPPSFNLRAWGTLNFEPLENIMKKIKGPTAVYANRFLNRSGKFWQKESYDHYVRNHNEFERIVGYILKNPEKAGLVGNWEPHPFTYLKGYQKA